MPVAAETPVGAEGGQHRVLVFAQLKVVVLLHLGALPDYNWKHRDFSHAEVE
jgi:hypothetical protein